MFQHGYNPKKKYTLRKEFENVELSYGVVFPDDIPQFGNFIEDRIRQVCSEGSKISHTCDIRSDYTFTNTIMECNACVVNYGLLELIENTGIGGQTLEDMVCFSPCGERVYANPNFWENICDHHFILDVLTPDEQEYLFQNPRAMPYIESHPDRVLCNLPSLFANPSAVNFIIQQNFSPKEMVRYGAKYEHFYQYFDHAYCEEFFSDNEYGNGIGNGIGKSLILNPAAKELVRKNIQKIEEYNSVLLGTIAKSKHHWGLIYDNIDLFTQEDLLDYLNMNPLAVDHLSNNRAHIRWDRLARNPSAKHLLVPETNSRTICRENQRDCFFEMINCNPCMIDFLLARPDYVTDAVLLNPMAYIEK